MLVTKALALTGIKVVMDDGLFKEVSTPTPPLSVLDHPNIIVYCRSGIRSVNGYRHTPVADRSDDVESVLR